MARNSQPSSVYRYVMSAAYLVGNCRHEVPLEPVGATGKPCQEVGGNPIAPLVAGMNAVVVHESFYPCLAGAKATQVLLDLCIPAQSLPRNDSAWPVIQEESAASLML